jgi:hypothetical protein
MSPWKYTDATQQVAFRALVNGGMESRATAAIDQAVDGPILLADFIDQAPARIAAAWAAADALAVSTIDHNSRERFLAWLIDPATSSTKRQRIADVQAWMDSIWQHFYVVKAQITAGEDVQFNFATPCPWTFWDIANA